MTASALAAQATRRTAELIDALVVAVAQAPVRGMLLEGDPLVYEDSLQGGVGGLQAGTERHARAVATAQERVRQHKFADTNERAVHAFYDEYERAAGVAKPARRRGDAVSRCHTVLGTATTGSRMALKFRLAAQDDKASILLELVDRFYAAPMAQGMSVRARAGRDTTMPGQDGIRRDWAGLDTKTGGP